MSEHEEQKALFAWARLATKNHPELSLLHAIPNGGHRDIRVARKLKAEGVKPGVPDMCLPVARGDYHGLYIELKKSGGRPSDNQKTWLSDLNAQGYKAVIAYGWVDAKTIIEEYLKLEVK